MQLQSVQGPQTGPQQNIVNNGQAAQLYSAGKLHKQSTLSNTMQSQGVPYKNTIPFQVHGVGQSMFAPQPPNNLTSAAPQGLAQIGSTHGSGAHGVGQIVGHSPAKVNSRIGSGIAGTAILKTNSSLMATNQGQNILQQQANIASQHQPQHQYNGYPGPFIDQTQPAGIAGINLVGLQSNQAQQNMSADNTAYTFYQNNQQQENNINGDSSLNRQLLNNRSSNMQQIGFMGLSGLQSQSISDNQIQQYQQLEQKLLQKHQEKQNESNGQRINKEAVFESFSSQMNNQNMITGPGISKQNVANIGTNYQLPNLNIDSTLQSNITAVTSGTNASSITAITANSTSMLFQTPQVRPGSKKMSGVHQQMTQKSQNMGQNNQNIFQGAQGINSDSSQFQQLQHLQQMQEFHSQKKQQRVQNSAMKSNQLKGGLQMIGGTLSSKNLQTFQKGQPDPQQYRKENKRFSNYNKQNSNVSRQHTQDGQEQASIQSNSQQLVNQNQYSNTYFKKNSIQQSQNLTALQQIENNMAIMNFQQQAIDNYNNQGQQIFQGENLQPVSLQNQAQQQQFQESRNKDSRNSKRSVVFSKSKQNSTGVATGIQPEAPSTPKITNLGGMAQGFKGNNPQRGLANDSQLIGQQQLQNGQIQLSNTNSVVSNQQILSSGSKMKVNQPLQTQKVNKSNPKNIVFANQNGPVLKQYQQMSDMQLTMNNQQDDLSQQSLFVQQQQQIYNSNNQKAFINSKRRSNVNEIQIRDNGLSTSSQMANKTIGSQSALKQHSRVSKKMNTSNMNVVTNSQDQNQIIVQANQNNMFNKTMSSMATGINGQAFQGLNQQPAANPNMNGSMSFIKPAGGAEPPAQNLNLQNSLVVVRLNSIKPQEGPAPQQKVQPGAQQPQYQIQSISSLTPEQQQQLIQQQQMIIQQQQQNQLFQQQMISKQIQLQQTQDPQAQTSLTGGNASINQHQTSQSLANAIPQQNSQKNHQEMQNSSQSQRQKIKVNRPQSQNHRMIQGMNNSNTFNNNVSQHSGSNEGTITVTNRKIDHNASQSQDPTIRPKPMAQIQMGQNFKIQTQNPQSDMGQIQPQKLSLPQSNMIAVPGQAQSQSPAQKLISTKHLQIQQIRMVNNNSSVDNYAHSDTDSQRQQNTQFNSGQSNLLKQNSGSPGNSKYFIKNQLRHISNMADGDGDDEQDSHNDHDLNIDTNHQGQNVQQQLREGGMTLEDDVESMLSEQFNTSNESMFRVRGVAGQQPGTVAGGLQLGGAGGGGDSTYRCNDSMYDEDRGLISESEDGWNAEKDGQGDWKDNNIDDISEHSSDEMTDSEPEEIQEGGIIVKKVKKTKGEKGEKRKKKKKKIDSEAQEKDKANANVPAKEQAQTIPKEQTGDPKKIVQTYKKLQEDSKKGSKSDQNKVSKQQSNNKEVKKKDTAQQIKVNIQTKKNEKSSNQNDMNMSKNNFNSPMIKGKGQEKMNQNNKQSNQNNNNKQAQNQKIEKKTIDDTKKEQHDTVPATPLKKAKKNGIKLQALNNALPKNLQECHERFFESSFKVNPQFEYENAQLALKFLEQFDEPDGQYLAIAKRILDSFLGEYGSESQYLDAEGKKLDQDETHQAITDYLNNLGVQEWISINFQKNQVAPTSVTHDPKTGKCKMNIKLPCEYREGRMMGVLDHEIGTHFLRKHNEKLQQWYKKREKFDMKTCIATEEGLACTNQMVQTVKDGKCKPFLYRSALNYYAAYQAKQMSFVDLFRDLEKYVNSPQSRWKFVLRVKRGLTDTSQKGGLYKDQVYLEGAVKVLQRRKELNFKALLCGKLSLFDYDREDIQGMLNYEGQLLPPFMEDMEEYMRCLDQIAETNHIEDNLVESQWGSEDEKIIENQERIERLEFNNSNPQSNPTNIENIIPSQEYNQAEIKTDGERIDDIIAMVPTVEDIKGDREETGNELKISDGPSPISVTQIDGDRDPQSPGIGDINQTDLSTNNLNEQEAIVHLEQPSALGENHNQSTFNGTN